MSTAAEAVESLGGREDDERWRPIQMKGAPRDVVLSPHREFEVTRHDVFNGNGIFHLIDIRSGTRTLTDHWHWHPQGQRLSSPQERPEVIGISTERHEEIRHVAAITDLGRPGDGQHARDPAGH